MKVIINLMEVYSDYIGLPMLLVNADGKIDYKVDAYDCSLVRSESPACLLELKEISLQITNPTIMSLSVESLPTSVFYIITPTFIVDGVDRFIAAGPFLIEPFKGKKHNALAETIVTVFSDEDIEVGISKMRKLHQILTKKVKLERGVSIPKPVIEVLQLLGDLDREIVDSDALMYQMLETLLEVDALEFIGLAIKNGEDVFVIECIVGENVQHLAEKRFYMGEGLLGMAAISGLDLNWSKDQDSQKAEFFNRYGIYPNHVVGIPFEQVGMATSMLIGGNFNEKGINSTLLYLLKCVIRLFIQRKNMQTKIVESTYYQAVYTHWLNLMDSILHPQENKHLPDKILDLCQILNRGKFSCFTSIEGEFFSQGTTNQEVVMCHKEALVQPIDDVWIFSNCIFINVQHLGIFTVEFDAHTELQSAFYMLEMVEKLLQQQKGALEQPMLAKNASIFDLLHTTMQEMNDNKYRMANLAVVVATNLTETLQISAVQKQRLLNICRVFPYGLDYLAKHISHTQEWSLLRVVQVIIQEKETLEMCTIETKILAFIYQVIIKGQPKESMNFLITDLSVLFIRTYEDALKSMVHKTEQPKLEIGHEQMEEMTDIKSIISTLALTSREKEILYLILEGMNNQEVGEYLKISVHTVKNHVTNIFKKLNVSDRIHAMTKIYRIKYGEV